MMMVMLTVRGLEIVVKDLVPVLGRLSAWQVAVGQQEQSVYEAFEEAPECLLWYVPVDRQHKQSFETSVLDSLIDRIAISVQVISFPKLCMLLIQPVKVCVRIILHVQPVHRLLSVHFKGHQLRYVVGDG